MRDAASVADVPAARDADHEGLIGAVGGMQRIREPLCHGTIPGRLRIDEMPETRPVATSPLRIGRFRMELVDLVKILEVSRRGRRGARDPLLLRGRHGVPTFIRYRLDEFAVDVQRSHRNSVDAREPEERQVKLRANPPNLLPIRLLQQLPLRKLSRDPLVQDRLSPARE